MDRKCRKCGEYIPHSTVIDGKRKSLQNRKFCLVCSPYKNHNTKKYLNGTCDTFAHDPNSEPKKKLRYSEWPENKKSYLRTKTYLRGINRKKTLVEMAGGKCLICGYSKCIRALSFHHRDPSTKLFCLNINVLWGTAWDKILAEVQKCDLLCVRCHVEIEDKISKQNSNIYRDMIELNGW